MSAKAQRVSDINSVNHQVAIRPVVRLIACYRLLCGSFVYFSALYGIIDTARLYDPVWYQRCALVYTAGALACLLLVLVWPRFVRQQYIAHLSFDLLLLGLIFYYSGGSASGHTILPIMAAAFSTAVLPALQAFGIVATSVVILLGIETFLALTTSWSASVFVIGVNGLAAMGLMPLLFWLNTRLRRAQQTEQTVRLDYQQLAEVNWDIINCMNTGCIIVDEHGLIVHINPSACALFASRADASTGQNLATFSEQLHRLYQQQSQAGFHEARPVRLVGLDSYVLPHFFQLERGRRTVILLDNLHEEIAHIQQSRLATFGKMIHALMHEIKNPLAVIEQALQRYSSADEADADALKSAASEPASSYPQMGAYAQPEQVAQSIDTQPDTQARDDARRGERSDAQARGGAHRGAQSGAPAVGGAQSDAQARDGAHRGAQSGAQAGDGVRRGAQSGAPAVGGAQSDAQARDGAHRGAQSGAPAVGGVRGGVAHAQPNAGDRTDAQSGAPAKTAGATGINRQDWNNEFIPLLIRQISRMVAIVHSTRNLLPNRLPEQDNIDLLAHLREVIEDLGQPQRDDGSAIWFDLDTSALAALTVHFDPTHLSQIISNLIRNSIDHAQVDPGELHINITGRHAGNFIELEYWDNGIGIDAHKREHIWKAFYSSDHEHAGLGLHISNELCQINGATLEYISLAVPARFRLSLPNAH